MLSRDEDKSGGAGLGERVQGGLGRLPGRAVGGISAVHRTEGTEGSGKMQRKYQGPVLAVS